MDSLAFGHDLTPSVDALSLIVKESGVACLYLPDPGAVWRASPGLSALLGREAEWTSWQDSTFGALMHGEDSFEFMSTLEALRHGTPAESVKLRLRHVAGNWRQLSGRCSVQGASAVVVFSDLTQAIQTETALIDSQMRLRGLYDAAPVAILLWNRDGRITDWNRMAEQVFGYARNEAVGLKLAPSLIHPSEYQRFSASVADALARNAEIQLSCRSLNRAGETLVCEWHTVPLRNPRGSLMGLFSIALDVTEKEAAAQLVLQAKEEAEKLSLAKTAFLSTISHELRTPLNGVLGMAQVIQLTRAADSELQEYVSEIRLSGGRLRAIVDAILSYTSIDLREEARPTSSLLLREHCAGLEARFAAEAAAKGLSCRFVYQTLGDLALPAQSLDIDQILVRLLDNAICFTESGGISFLAEIEADERHVSFSVTDSGCGIPAEFMPHLFTPFKQASAGLSRKRDGLGMGLAIARKLADGLNAELRLESPAGEGVTARLRVPLPSM